MRVRWFGLGWVAILVISLLVLKNRLRTAPGSIAVNSAPAVVLIADLREANETKDNCALIIRAVREAARRGVSTAEISPASSSDLIRRYHVLTVPTVLLLDPSGKEIGRFEGEDAKTVHAVEANLASLSGGRQ